MIAPTRTEIDLIEELQHRRWARENYVAAPERDRSWHPVVLDEMRRRDRELRELRIDPPAASARDALAPQLAAVELRPHWETIVRTAGTRSAPGFIVDLDASTSRLPSGA